MNVFAPILRIAYSERINIVSITLADMDGKYNFAAPIQLDHDKLPLLFFQLIDRGYKLGPDPEEKSDDFKVVYAFSPEYCILKELEMRVENGLAAMNAMAENDQNSTGKTNS